MADGSCIGCGKECPSTRNNAHRCPDCVRAYKRDWAKKRRAQGLQAGGKVSARWMKAYQDEYHKKPEVKKRKAEQMRKYTADPKLRMRHEARWQVHHAIQSGKLKRRPCMKCGANKSEAHHPDYYKPLDVIWLCRSCHRAEHAKADGKVALNAHGN